MQENFPKKLFEKPNLTFKFQPGCQREGLREAPGPKEQAPEGHEGHERPRRHEGDEGTIPVSPFP